MLFPLWKRIAAAARRENVGSMADFISSRYGKSPALGAAVAVVAILGSLPYIALQLKSLSMAGEMITAGTPVPQVADVLRHRDVATTSVYARINVAHLAQVAMPWPGGCDDA